MPFHFPPSGSGISFKLYFACFIVAIRACSFLSNSYILEEGKVASFLLASSGIVKLRDSIKKKKMVLKVIVLLLVITICRLSIEVGLSKQTPGFDCSKFYPSWMLRSTYGLPILSFITEIVPVIFLMLLAIFLYKAMGKSGVEGLCKYVIMGSIWSYVLIAVHWASENNILSPAWVLGGIGRNLIPRIIYAIGFAQLLLLMFHQLFNRGKSFDWKKSLVDKTVAMLSACSSTIIILLGKQGALVSIAAIIGGYCVMRLGNIKHDDNNKGTGNSTINPLTVTQWSILAVCLFFCTGHWCAFDGLRYGAAFIGFDEFILVQQAILLTIDTFGLSLILPISGLPFLVACQTSVRRTENQQNVIFARLSLVYLLYGLVMAATVTATMLCVAIHRRHLMVWGLFAPKFVFDVAGLVLTDFLICLASLYYFSHNSGPRKQIDEK